MFVVAFPPAIVNAVICWRPSYSIWHRR